MLSLAFLLIFVWFLAVVGGGHARTGGLVHLALFVALVMVMIGGA